MRTVENLSAIAVFVSVADHGSFVAAGKHLGISASAVGKSIARLEERISVRLFHRSTRSIALTAEGMRFLERCRRILGELESAEQEFAETAAQPKGRLKVGLPMAGDPFISVMAHFQMQYPGVELDMLFADRMVDLIEEGFDVVIRTGEVADSGLTAKRLGTFRMVLVASPDYLRLNGRPSKLEDLHDHRCIQFRFPDSGRFQRWMLQGPDGLEPFDPAAVTVCSSLEARLGFAMEGVGISYLPDFTVRRQLEVGNLELVLDDLANYINVVRLLWSSGKNMPQKLRAFIDFVSAELPLNP